MGGRALSRALVTLVAAAVGAAWLSGTDQPVTARPFPQWQEVARPPLSPRTQPLGLRIGHRVLVLGGRDRGDRGLLRDGAAYDLRTGLWHRLGAPVAVTDRDTAVAASGVAVIRHLRPGRAPAWWRYDARRGLWARIRQVPPHASVPSAFHSEVYAVTARHVVVYSVQLGRWHRLPADRLRPVLRDRRVRATRSGTVVTGYAGRPARLVADRWDGLSWHRLSRLPLPVEPGAAPGPRLPSAALRSPATRVPVGGRLLVVAGSRAWIHTP